MKKLICLFLLITFSAYAKKPLPEGRPKLIVGIVVDQMRYDYLYRYEKKYGEGGFKRLLREGYSFRNANFNYVPTYTAPGHACIYTGTTPSVNGIISNDWYDRISGKSIYCVSDTTVKPVGTTSISGKMSPKNLLSSTVTDELRMSDNFRSKVIGIALKDRGAILPAGRSANAAYWHDPYSDRWVSSTYYMNELPVWVNVFNDQKLGALYTSKPWTTLLPIDQYTESLADDNEYEGVFKGEVRPVFPHDIPKYKGPENDIIRRTPFGNTFTKDFAIAAVKGEDLGKGPSTDFLAVSFSSTDYVGHMYGINAIEMEDTYLRLDKDLSEMLNFLDEWTGGDYLVFITADHGAVYNPEFAKDHGLHAGGVDEKKMVDSLKKFLVAEFGTDKILSDGSSTNIYLDRVFIRENKMDLELIQNKCAEFVMGLPSVAVALTATELSKGLDRTGIYRLMQNGFNPQRSADVMIQLHPGWIDWYSKTGTTHGAAYSYDTHVPMIFFGKNVPSGYSNEVVYISDIAPTIATLLNIEFPSGNTGRPVLNIKY